MAEKTLTRFAPSPTGFLHIGGARTALFNWLYAKQNGGEMLLRIEDTDRARSTDEAIAAIKDGLNWLGLEWQGEAISQFARADRHSQVAKQLVDSGKAYYCYTTPDELAEMRAEAEAEKRPFKYDGRWRDRSPNEAPEGVAPVIRLKTPQSGAVQFNDKVQGEIKINHQELDDFILLRSDGTPVYMLAVVVDDHDMEVTDIIRGDDHLTNAAKQILIYQALGWSIPSQCHIPLIHGADGAKLSKRHGALGVEAYRAMGYLPDAIRNYLVRLGWSHGDQEFFTTKEMVDFFNCDAIGKGPSRFDFDKLNHMNAHYLRNSDATDIISHCKVLFDEMEDGAFFKENWTDEIENMAIQVMPGLTEKAKTLLDVIEGMRFLFESRPIEIDDKKRGMLEKGGLEVLKQLAPKLEAIENWEHDAIDATVREFAEQNELGLGKIAPPLRITTTGGRSAIGVFEILETLGKTEVLARIQDQID
jgi:glutamyl-tRNA synthetase